MPHINFVLPHWLYWGGLLFVPLMAMYIVRKQRGKTVDGVLSIPIAYLLWLCGGFAGLQLSSLAGLDSLPRLVLSFGVLLSVYLGVLWLARETIFARVLKSIRNAATRGSK